ncbi:S8 family serine peptidase [Candidatus Kaiserbacteria bacterium]|nr:S8 family serine peptidase [Candidatus Kaiserbacteria bacterium]
MHGFAARIPDAELDAVKNDPRVEFVSEDRVVSTTDARSAGARERGVTELAKNGTLFAQAQSLPTGIDRINAENKTNKGAGVQVAVIDTGIYVNHPDLKANVLGGKNCISSNKSAYIDQNGHGTHVAGTIAALDNGQGVVGVAPAAKLWAIRVLDRNGNGTWSSVICGLDAVAASGPKYGGSITVANMSLGGSGTSDNNCGNTNNDALHKAVCRVRDAGITLVVAAGNSGANAANFVPAAYDDAVITVSALADSNGTSGGGGAPTSYGADDTFASFSNWGTPVDIGAPGVNIYSTWLSNGYKTISGTSMASPHVAGAAALYVATHPGALWTDVRNALVAAGEAVGAGHTDPSGKHPELVLRADTL